VRKAQNRRAGVPFSLCACSRREGKGWRGRHRGEERRERGRERGRREKGGGWKGERVEWAGRGRKTRRT